MVGLDAWQAEIHGPAMGTSAYTVKTGESRGIWRLTNIRRWQHWQTGRAAGGEKRMLTLGIRMNDPILEREQR